MKPLRAPLALFVAATAMAAIPAQEAPPSPIQACQSMAGVWTGSGKVMPTGDPAQSMAFQATIDSSWVAGGEALLEVVKATMENGDTMELVHLYAYDRRAGTIRVSGIGTDGMFHSSAAGHHVGNATLQTVWVGEDPSGTRFSEFFNWTVAGDVLTLDIQRSLAGGRAFTFATGSFARQKQEAGTIEAAQVRGAELVEHLSPLAPMIGDYVVTGQFHGQGEMPAFGFGGNEWNQPVAGGLGILSRLEMQSEDGQIQYSAVAITGWDAQRKAYRRAESSNLNGGAISTMGVAADGSFYSATATRRDGAPYVEAMQFTLKDGRLASARIDGMIDGASRRVVDMNFEPVAR